MSGKKQEGGAPAREVVVRAPARLAEMYEHIGLRVRLVIDRIDGRELSPGAQVTARAVVAGYEADEHRPAVTAADVNVIEGLEELAKQEEEEERKARKAAPKAKAKPARPAAKRAGK
jgi:hypothetical protein